MLISKDFMGTPATALDRIFNRVRLEDKVARKGFLDGMTADRIGESTANCLNAYFAGERVNIDEDVMRVFRVCSPDEIKELFGRLGLDMKSNIHLVFQFLPSTLLEFHSELFYESGIDNVDDAIAQRAEKEMEEQYDSTNALGIIRGEREIMEAMM